MARIQKHWRLGGRCPSLRGRTGGLAANQRFDSKGGRSKWRTLRVSIVRIFRVAQSSRCLCQQSTEISPGLRVRAEPTRFVCYASLATPVHSRGECCLRDGLAQDLFVTQARPHGFIHVVNVVCETDWHRTCLSRKHGHTGSLTW